MLLLIGFRCTLLCFSAMTQQTLYFLIVFQLITEIVIKKMAQQNCNECNVGANLLIVVHFQRWLAASQKHCQKSQCQWAIKFTQSPITIDFYCKAAVCGFSRVPLVVRCVNSVPTQWEESRLVIQCAVSFVTTSHTDCKTAAVTHVLC